RVQLADVDAQLERVGRDDREQVALCQAALQLAAMRGRVAGAVGGDPLRQVGPAGVLAAEAREALDPLDAPTRLEEADRSHLLLDQAREQLRGLGQHRRPLAGVLVYERR